MTILLIEQNANMALKVAHQAYVLETGKITMSGTGQELLENPDIKAAYLGKKRNQKEMQQPAVFAGCFCIFQHFLAKIVRTGYHIKREWW